MPTAIGLADDGDDGDMVELRVVEPVQQVDRAGAARRGADPHVAAEFRVTDRFEGRHLLVAGLDELRHVVGPAPRGEQAVDAVARIAEDLPHLPFTQSAQQDIGDRRRPWNVPSVAFSISLFAYPAPIRSKPKCLRFARNG